MENGPCIGGLPIKNCDFPAMLVLTRQYHQWLPKEESHRKKLRSLRQMRVIFSLHPWNFIKAAGKREKAMAVLLPTWWGNFHIGRHILPAIEPPFLAVNNRHCCWWTPILLVKPHTTGISNLQSYIVIIIIYTIIFIHRLYTIIVVIKSGIIHYWYYSK